MLTVSWSRSVAEAKHVKLVEVVTEEVGVIPELPNTGEVFSTVTSLVLGVASPSESVAVAVQVMTSPTFVSVVSTV